METYNILVCDDDPDIVNALAVCLKKEGYHPIPACNGKEALEIVGKGNIHLVLLDIMMPGLDGIAAAKEIRSKYNMPILFLTAKGEDEDKIRGLNSGADDYITKPFCIAELLARVRAQLRRYLSLGGKSFGGGILTCGTITLNDEKRKVTVGERPVELTPIEFDILRLLMENEGRVFSAAQIYSLVWKDDPFGAENTVAVHIRHLREKIEEDPAFPKHLKAVWGQGYKFEKGEDQ